MYPRVFLPVSYFRSYAFEASVDFIILANNKQIFHAFLFNIRNFSPEEINIQQSVAELNII